MNAYGFANGDPINFSDPFGLCPPQTGWEPGCTRDKIDDAGLIDPIALVGGLEVKEGETLALGAEALAKSVADATGGAVSSLAKSDGFKVTVNASRSIVARIKKDGAIRVGIDGLGALTKEGVVSADRALTHLKDLSSKEIVDLVNKAREILNAK